MKKLKCIFICLIIVLLSGCMKINASFKVLDDGNYNFHINMLIEEESYNKLNLDFGIIKEMIDEETSIKTENIKEYEKMINNKKYLGYQIQYSHKSPDEIDNIHVTFNDNKDEITFKIDSSTFGDNFINLDALGFGEESFKVLKENGVEIVVRIEMPGKITYASKGNITGDIVTIDILQEDFNDVIIVSKIDKPYLEILLFILIPAIIIYMYYHFKYRKDEQ